VDWFEGISSFFKLPLLESYLLGIVEDTEMPGLGKLETYLLLASIAHGKALREKRRVNDRCALVPCGPGTRSRSDTCTEIVDYGYCEFEERGASAGAIIFCQ
jgi:hypothetical protein